jgi:predicted Zn-dependent protease
MTRQETGQERGRQDDVRETLSRAYLLVGWGQVDAAVALCEQVDADLGGEHPLPQTLAGGFLVGAGRINEGLKRLGATVRRFPRAPLPGIQFAEACFLAGRRRQAERAMDRVRPLLEEASDESHRWYDSLRDVWLSDDPPAVDTLPVGPV